MAVQQHRVPGATVLGKFGMRGEGQGSSGQGSHQGTPLQALQEEARNTIAFQAAAVCL